MGMANEWLFQTTHELKHILRYCFIYTNKDPDTYLDFTIGKLNVDQCQTVKEIYTKLWNKFQEINGLKEYVIQNSKYAFSHLNEPTKELKRLHKLKWKL